MMLFEKRVLSWFHKKGVTTMKSIIHELYAENYSGHQPQLFHDAEKQRQWEQDTAFYNGFCLGAHLILEVLTCPDLE